MVILGDSSAAGYGVHRPRETPGALLATGISRRLRRPVRLHRLAVVGSISAGLPYQVDAALEYAPELAVILIGGNDVTHGTAGPRGAPPRRRGPPAARRSAARVVVGTCPDLGAIQPIKPPLRWLARRWSRQLAAAQTVAVVEAGGRTVSLGDLLGPAFEAEPVRMFASDRFHPSAEGYARAAAVMLPTLLAALGEDDRAPAPGPEGVRSLPQAAHEAVRAAGTEVSPARGRRPRARSGRAGGRSCAGTRGSASSGTGSVPQRAGPVTGGEPQAVDASGRRPARARTGGRPSAPGAVGWTPATIDEKADVIGYRAGSPRTAVAPSGEAGVRQEAT